MRLELVQTILKRCEVTVYYGALYHGLYMYSVQLLLLNQSAVITTSRRHKIAILIIINIKLQSHAIEKDSIMLDLKKKMKLPSNTIQ